MINIYIRLAVFVVLLNVVFVLGTAEQIQEDFAFTDMMVNERRLSVDGRSMTHMHLQSTPLYGNSTDFMYYYITVYFGSQR